MSYQILKANAYILKIVFPTIFPIFSLDLVRSTLTLVERTDQFAHFI